MQNNPSHPAFDTANRHPAFFSSRMKLGRAGGMIEAFERLVNAYVSEGPSRLITEQTRPGFIRITIQTDRTPAEVPMIVGEILHNMRGALDHLASSVVEHSKQIPNSRVNFPVHETKSQFCEMKTRKKDPHQLSVAAPDVWNIIETTYQPWQVNDTGSLLWAVSKLNNIDKHRFLLILPFRSFAPIDGFGNGISMQNNLFIFEGSGDCCIYEGPALNLREETIYPVLMLREDSIIEKRPLLAFLKEAYNQVFSLIYAIETHMFGPNGTVKSA